MAEVRHGRPDKPEVESDFEEITETLVVGVTETGVLRKRSFKRRLTKGEQSKLRGYGTCKAEYDAILTRILDQKMVRESIEALKERLRMVLLMRGDCLDLVSKWDETREMNRKRKQNVDLELCFLCSMGVVFMIVCLLLIRWCW